MLKNSHVPHYGSVGSDGLFSCELEGSEELEKIGLTKVYNVREYA